MAQAKWIWYFGDFEIYHHMLLSCRRQEFGCDYPCCWHVSRPELNVRFYKTFIAEKEFELTVTSHSKGMVRLAGKLRPVNQPILCPPGEHTVSVELYDIEKFPACFIDSECLVTDESWAAEAFDRSPAPVGCEPVFSSPADDPAVFPFSYREIAPVSVEEARDGILYDFGKETFAALEFPDLRAVPLFISYGESREEALDAERAILWERIDSAGKHICPPRAFRYLWLHGENVARIRFRAYYEYLEIEDRAAFSCDRPKIADIWDVCAYTFHLNTREFFLDGIKRDRWVWSGDAYQSFMIARYLYNDPSVTERTIVALFGKPPYRTHINTINDYSAYLILSVWDHYFATGNRTFLEAVYPKVQTLFAFIAGRLDERGYVVKRTEDWIFIDWGELDKDGPHCAEQILLWQVYNTMAKIAQTMGAPHEEVKRFLLAAATLKFRILDDFWDAEKGAFIDSFVSGKRFVSRQTNVFAILYDFVDGETKQSVIDHGLLDPALPAITTPYFKLYELLALCKIGKLTDAQSYVESYWGGMLNAGATSVWEAFDPARSGAEHYAMYGSPYGKSLCHAWGSGPILLLCRYCAGVAPASVGTKTFDVRPNPGLYRRFSATVPIRDGFVEVTYEAPELKVRSTVSGGTLYLNGRHVPLPVNETVRAVIR